MKEVRKKLGFLKKVRESQENWYKNAPNVKFIITKNCTLLMLSSKTFAFAFNLFFSGNFWNKSKSFMISLCIYYVVNSKGKVWGWGVEAVALQKSHRNKILF